MNTLRAIFYAVASVVLLTIGASFTIVLRHADQAIEKATLAKVDAAAMAEHADAAIQHLDGAAQHLDTAIQTVTTAAAGVAGVIQFERDSQKNQNDQVTHGLRELLKTAGDAHDLVVHTDCSVNGCPAVGGLPAIAGLLPTLAGTMKDLGDRAGRTIDDLDAHLRDEHLASFMANMDQASASFAQTSAHLASATGDIETKVHQMTRPASWAKNVGLTLLDLGSKLGNVFAGFVK